MPGINKLPLQENSSGFAGRHSAPLQIDTSDYETMERALRLYVANRC
ncbi:MAG: hypothetical protein ACLR2G_01930 [Phascolarctobacterium faecium]